MATLKKTTEKTTDGPKMMPGSRAVTISRSPARATCCSA